MTPSILCTIDLNDHPREAIQWAVTIARQLNLHLTILHTYRLIYPEKGDMPKVKKAIEHAAREQFSIMEKEFLTGKGLNYDLKVEIGFVTDRIEDHARKNSMSLLVVNRNIRGQTKEAFEELMNTLQVPTLLIP
jgi:hypothetical protein